MMLPWQKEGIKRRHNSLCKNTNCNPQIIVLVQDFINDGEKSELEGIQSAYEKSKRLYEIMMTKHDGFDLLVRALEGGGQTGAVTILRVIKEEWAKSNQSDNVEKLRQFEDMELGDPECTEADVAAVIRISKKFPDLHKKWDKVGEYLGIARRYITTLALDYSNGKVKGLPELLDKLLSLWKDEKKGHAKIILLCDAFEKNDLLDISQAIRSKIGKSEIVQEIKFQWQGNVMTLEELLGESTPKETYQKIYAELRKQYFNEPLQIIKENLIQPKFYISRNLSHFTSTEVSQDIFTSYNLREHTFLFKGMETTQLARLAKESDLVASPRLQHKFILLECDKDFARISMKERNPVHRIEAKDVVRHFLMDKKVMCESGMVARITSFSSARPFIIADSPGMGKTLLLANLANKIHQERHGIVLFIVLQEFLPYITLHTKCFVNNTSSVLAAIAAYSSSDHKTEMVLFEILRIGSQQLYLFFDGYDEVQHDKVDLVDKFLLCILKEHRNAKVVVTTRPHFQARLENLFGQFAYEILPLSDSSQIKFLTSYWIEKHGLTEGDNLSQFARQCTLAINSTTKNEEREIAGIPLQCWMLAQVCAEHAEIISGLGTKQNDSVAPKPIPMSYFEMYKRLIEYKFGKVEEEGLRQKYLDAHMQYAIELLFPYWTSTYKIDLHKLEQIDEETLYSIGLIEYRHPSHSPRFIHRTFAEYILANFVVDKMKKDWESLDVLFGEILGLKGLMPEERGKPRESKYPVVAYFIEMHLMEHKSIDEFFQPRMSTLYIHKFTVEDLCAAIRECVRNGFETSFEYCTKVLDLYPHIPTKLMDVYLSTLPNAVIERFNSVKLLEKVLTFLSSKFEIRLTHPDACFPWMSLSIALHETARKGKYSMFKYMVDHYSDENICSHLKHILHNCVSFSDGSHDLVIQEKIKIIEDVVKVSRGLLEEMDKEQRTPLLQTGIHFTLLQRLVEHGANINAYASKHGTILHGWQNRNTYPEIARWALSNGFKLINHTDEIKRTPIMCAIQLCGSLDDQTLNQFYEAGADLNALDCDGNSVLFYAFENANSLSFIKKFLEFGVDVNHKNHYQENVLHAAARSPKATDDNLKIIDLLVGMNRDWLSERTKYGDTPLLQYNVDLSILKRLVERGADININCSDAGTLLHRVADCRNNNNYTDVVRWALSSGFNLVDYKHIDRTPLMQAFRAFWNSESQRNAVVEAEVVKLFRDAGADLNICDVHGNSGLFYAIKHACSVDVIKELLQDETVLIHKNLQKENALHKLIEDAQSIPIGDRLDILEVMVRMKPDLLTEKNAYDCTPFLQRITDLGMHQRLVELGADINEYSRLEGTVIHMLIKIENPPSELKEGVQWAFSNEFKLINHTDKHKRTPLMHVLKVFGQDYVDDEVIKLFIDAGADLNARDVSGHTVLSVIRSFGKGHLLNQ